jgi:hypothetical protein
MKRPLKVAGWCRIFSIALSAVLWIYMLTMGVSYGWFVILAGLVEAVLSILYRYGFVVLGKKFDSPILLVMGWIGIVLGILAGIFGLVEGILARAGMATAQLTESAVATGATDVMTPEVISTILLGFLVVWVVIAIFMGAYSILFGIGLLKIKDKVKYARVSGILEIIAGATYIILIGIVVELVAYIFEIVMMFKASKKYEK